jgi:homoserine kinase
MNRSGWTIRVPASTANVGAAFDALGIALRTHLEVSDDDRAPTPETHPAVRAFRHGGGTGPLSVRAQFPGGRGMGFSGAARVAGLAAAYVQSGRSVLEARPDVLRVATELEGHADNVAASLLGGIIAVAAGRAVRVVPGCDLALVVWVPNRETTTTSARRLLPTHVRFEDAAFNVGRTALLVAALAAGDTDALRAATEDRLHQDHRLSRVPETRVAIDTALRAGAYAAWLSGSGPSAAAFVLPGNAREIAAAMPDGGRAMVLAIAEEGAAVTTRSTE